MTGRQWLIFLDQCDGTNAFSNGIGKVLSDGIYRRDFDTDATQLQTLVSSWIARRYAAASGGQNP